MELIPGQIDLHFPINEVRLDRFITLNMARPLRSVLPSFQSSGSSLPVLMYHSISDRDESGVHDYFKVCTSPERFRLQMKTLQENGWTGADLESALARLKEDPTNKAQLVAITFDDGFHDFYTEAMPVLKEHGFGATMYLPTDFIQDERRSFKGIDCMRWSEVRKCQPMGIRFGSHTRSHPKLYEQDWSRIRLELSESKSRIEQELEISSNSFAYPYSFPGTDPEFCGRLGNLLSEIGYQSCATTMIGRVGRTSNRFLLPRLPINGLDDDRLLIAKVMGNYDWFGRFQAVNQSFRRRLGKAGRRNTAPEASLRDYN